MRDVRVASVQMESAPGDKDANFRKVERLTGAAAERGASMVLFPECCLTGYWFLRRLTVPQLRDLAEPVPEGPSGTRLLDLALKHHVTVGAGLVEAAGGDVFHNTYVVAMPDGRLVRHRKLHAFEHPAIHAGTDSAPPSSSATTTTSWRTSASRRCAGPRSCSHRTRPAAAAPRTRISWA